MSYTQVPALTSFTSGTTIVSSEVNSNFSAIRDVVNALVTGADTIQAARVDPVSGAGVGVNIAGDGHILARVGGSFTSDGGSNAAYGLRAEAAVSAADGDTGALAQVSVAGGSITTQGNSETVAIVASVIVADPNITVGSGDTVTLAASLYVSAAPTEGASNYAVYVASGAVGVGGAGGIDFLPGSDVDCDIVTVQVTGTPRMYWDESISSFRFTQSLYADQDVVVAGDISCASGEANFGAGLLVADAGASTLAFFNQPGGTRPTVTGSRGGNAALTSLMTALAGLGLVEDSTS